VWIVVALVLLVLAGVSGTLAWGALSNLWADYKDSPDSTYLAVGLPALAVAAAALAGAVAALRRRPR
jgi:hypothetical protein